MVALSGLSRPKSGSIKVSPLALAYLTRPLSYLIWWPFSRRRTTRLPHSPLPNPPHPPTGAHLGESFEVLDDEGESATVDGG